MQVASYSDIRKNLKSYLDEVFLNRDPLIITRKNNENLVVISLDDYNSLTETNYLLSSKKNEERLLSSLQKARSKNSFEKELIEE
ncbi:MAG: type II toxin-antitoxin system prevent-host-death family antitoxin [Spirochaetes bacterium]|nr:type II toxin-antitoxin system prevent-host-death family antitoxin [Spirochaetota bacterium]